MPLGNVLKRRTHETAACAACGLEVPAGSTYCNHCGVRLDEPDAQPLHVVDRATGLFNDRFLRPVLEDELARAHRYGRPLGLMLIEPTAESPVRTESDDSTLKVIAAAVAGAIREVDTPGVLGRNPVQLLVLLPDTDISGTAHAANRVLDIVNVALGAVGERARIGIACIHPAQRLRAGAAIEAVGRAARTGRPELLGR
ncbi:MAG TPA: hypothetical protein VNI34_01735 [Candidatus Nitrosotalea sp.]|nr:hypothetical protein [Candidatus Nitrosotalea sp.]